MGLGLDWLGDRVAASNSQFQWKLMNADGSNVTPLTNDHQPHPQLSACNDGKHVVYSTWRNGVIELWAGDADGSNVAKITDKPTLGGNFCGPDSKSVFYATEDGIWRTAMFGGTPVKTDLPLTQFAFSADGKLMVYVSQKIEGGAMQSKLIVTPAGDRKTVLHTLDAPFGMRDVQFTPDNKALAFLLARNRATNIWKQPLSGKSPTQLTKFSNGDMFAFAWSPDGKHLAFSRGQRKTDVVLMSNFR